MGSYFFQVLLVWLADKVFIGKKIETTAQQAMFLNT